MEYLIAVAFIKAFVDGIKTVLPLNEWWTKASVFVMSIITTLVYNLNALLAVGKASNVPLFDTVVTIVVVAVAAMTGSDILALISKTQRAAGPSTKAAIDAPPKPDQKV